MEVLILIIGLMVAEPLTSQNYNKIVVDNITAWILLTHTIELVENEKNKQFLELAPASTGSF